MTEQDFNSINDILKQNSDVTMFIKDYLLRFRFADIATHSMPNDGIDGAYECTSTSNVCDDYEKAADRIIEAYNDRVQEICDKDNIRTYCENDNLLGLKESLDHEKTIAFSQIISQYNGMDQFRYTSGKLSDFMLYDSYMEYITGDEFVYDENNPYVVELVYDIENFLNIRKKIERNTGNINSMISKFNSLCNKTIKKYLEPSGKDYYSHIKEIFTYDFYSNNDNDLIEAKINDRDRVTLYAKVLDYLKTMTAYVAPASAGEKYKDIDTETMMSGAVIVETDEELENESKLKNLKKIALDFTCIRKIESETDYSAFTGLTSDSNLNDIFALTEILDDMGMSIDDYNAACQINSDLLNYSRAVDSYIGYLKGITENEARILRDLSDRAVTWYLQNSGAIDDGSIFRPFMEVPWPSKTTIHKDGNPCDFFFIEDPDTDSKSVPDNYEFGEDSVATEAGVNSYKYWLKYFTIATISNCMSPMYWSTGLIVAGAPVKLPIIFVPIFPLEGRVTLVIGLGICGICPLPMIYIVNMGDIPGCVIPFVNMAIDMIKNLVSKITEIQDVSFKKMIEGVIKANDEMIDKKKEEIADLDMQIQNVSAGIGEDKETLRAMFKRLKKDPTTNARKNLRVKKRTES